MSKIKNSMDFEFVNSWAGVIVPGKIILVGYKNDGPVWAEVLENKVVGQALCVTHTIHALYLYTYP